MLTRLNDLPRAAVVVVFMVLSMGPLALLTYFAVSVSSDAVTERVKAGLGVESSLAALYVRQEMQGLAEVNQSFARRPVIVEALRRGPRRYDVAAIRRNLVELRQVRPGIGTAFVAQPDGRLIDIVPATPSIVGRDFSFRDWYRGVTRSGRTYVSEAYETQASNRANVVGVASVVHPLTGPRRRERQLAILVLAYRLDRIQAIVSRFSERQGLGLTITDQRGTVVAAPGLKRGARLVRLADDPLVRAALGGEKGIGERRRRGEEHVVAWTPVAGLGWTVLAEMPSSSAFADVTKLRKTVLLIASVLAAVLLGGLALLNTTLRLRQRAQEEVKHMARTDVLTTLPNRRAWEEALPKELSRAERDGAPLTIAMIDLDKFKAFNDTHGHQTGDQLLTDAAIAWSAQLRTTDLLARYGGEEFIVALPHCPPGAATTVLKRICEHVPGQETCSIGVATWDGHETAAQVVARADAALYEAKRTGRDRIFEAAGTA